MFDDEKEIENWDNINADVNSSGDEQSWDDILDNAVIHDDNLEDENDAPSQSSYYEEEAYPQGASAPNYVDGQVYDLMEDDEPVVETTSQSVGMDEAQNMYTDEQTQQAENYNNYKADVYEEEEANAPQNYQQNYANQSAQVNVNPRPIGIRQEKSSSKTPVILGIVVAILFALAGYMGYTYLKDNDLIPANGASTTDSSLTNTETQNDENLFDDVNQNQNQNEAPQMNEQAQPSPNDKVVVTVVNTGRTNPFTPTGNFSEAGYTIPRGLDIMAPPSYDENVTPNKIVDIVVSGILYDQYKPSAIITIGGIDHFVQRGDSIDDYVVSYIGPTSVTIRTGKNTYTASIGQQFNVNSRIGGETTYVRGKNGTTRQYFTPSEEDISNDY